MSGDADMSCRAPVDYLSLLLTIGLEIVNAADLEAGRDARVS